MYKMENIEQITYDINNRIMTVKTNKKFYYKNYLKDTFDYKVSFEVYQQKFMKFLKYKTNTKTWCCNLKNVPCVKFCESKEDFKCGIKQRNEFKN